MVGAFLRIGIEEREEEDFMEIRKATIDDLALGMLLSAIHEEDGEEKLHLLMVDDHIPAGAKLY